MQTILEFYQASRHHDVISYFKSSDLRPQTDPFACKFVAASYFQLGNFGEALELQQDIYSSFDGDPLFLSMHGATLRHLGRLEEANSIFKKALEIDSDSPALKNNYANLLIDLKRYPEALEILTDLTDADPQYLDAQQNLSRVKQLMASSPAINLDTSSQTISILADDDSDFFDPLFHAFSEEEVKRTAPFRPVGVQATTSQSLSNLQESLVKPDNNLVALDQLELAQRAITEGNPKYALELCSKATPELRHHAELFSCVGDAYISLKRFKDAESAYLHAVVLGGTIFKNYFNLASLALMKKNLNLVRCYLEKASSIDPSSPQVESMQKSLSRMASDASSKHAFSFLNDNPFPAV